MNDILDRSGSERLDFVDALRGLAVLGAVVVHTHQNFASHFVIPGIEFGMFGVQLFYIVSAYSLTISCANRMTTEVNPYRNYAIRRFFRIAPLFYFALILYLVIYFVLDDKSLLKDLTYANWPIETWHIVTSGIFLNGWHYQSINRIVPGGWSVAIETNFYILLPVILKFATSLKNSLLFLVCALILGKFLTTLLYLFFTPNVSDVDLKPFHIFAGMWLPSQLPVFSIGIVMYWATNRYLERASCKVQWEVPLLLWLGLTCVACVIFIDFPVVNRAIPIHVQMSLFLLFFSMILASGGLSFLVNKATIYVGKISYSVYLLHMAVLNFLLLMNEQFIVPYLKFQPDFLVMLPLVMLLVCILSSWTYKYIELPAQIFGKIWIRKLEGRVLLFLYWTHI